MIGLPYYAFKVQDLLDVVFKFTFPDIITLHRHTLKGIPAAFIQCIVIENLCIGYIFCLNIGYKLIAQKKKKFSTRLSTHAG